MTTPQLAKRLADALRDLRKAVQRNDVMDAEAEADEALSAFDASAAQGVEGEPVGYALSNPDGSPNLNAVYQRRENAEFYSQPQHAHGGFGPIVPLYIAPLSPAVVDEAAERVAFREWCGESPALALITKGFMWDAWLARASARTGGVK